MSANTDADMGQIKCMAPDVTHDVLQIGGIPQSRLNRPLYKAQNIKISARVHYAARPALALRGWLFWGTPNGWI